jgi:hypothetical protein
VIVALLFVLVVLAGLLLWEVSSGLNRMVKLLARASDLNLEAQEAQKRELQDVTARLDKSFGHFGANEPLGDERPRGGV